jgi:hypothetical protein
VLLVLNFEIIRSARYYSRSLAYGGGGGGGGGLYAILGKIATVVVHKVNLLKPSGYFPHHKV